MVQNGLGFMHSVSLKSHGPVLLSMKLLPYPVNVSWFPSALDKLNETALRRMVPAGYVTGELIARRYFFKKKKMEKSKTSSKSTHFFLFYHKRFHTFSNFDSNKTDDTSILRRNQPN